MDQTKRPIEDRVHEILDEDFWLPGLRPDEFYFRTQDDCDGDQNNGIAVGIDRQGDAWIQANKRSFSGYRYRMPLSGGGSSPRVRRALVILAEAIRLDNEEHKMGVMDEQVVR